VPLATPELWPQLPRLLFASESPLSIPVRNLAGLAPWLLRFAWNTRPSQLARGTAALAALLAAAPAAWQRLAAAARLDPLIRAGPVLVVARDAGSMAAKRPAMERLRRYGIAVEEIGTREARAMEPMLRPDVAGAFVYPDAQHTVDPAQLTRELVDAYRAAGGQVADDGIDAIEPGPGDTMIALGGRGSVSARQIVLAAGLGSREILARLAIRVPLAAERGYHLMVPYVAGTSAPRLPLIGASPQFVITPMRHGVRLAGTVELARTPEHPNWRRATMLKGLAEQLIEPLAGAREATMWMGCRPTLPDSLPVIGRIPGVPAMVGAFGHQHLGLTLAAITAEIVGALIRREPPPLAIEPYALSRF
jgi:D-amino-acid dehydrogenase